MKSFRAACGRIVTKTDNVTNLDFWLLKAAFIMVANDDQPREPCIATKIAR